MTAEDRETVLQTQLDDALALVEELAGLRGIIERGDYSERSGGVSLKEDDWWAINNASDMATKFLKKTGQT